MYQVIAFTDDGVEVTEFERFERAEQGAESWREAGTKALLCEVIEMYDPEDMPHSVYAAAYGVCPGIDFPGSLGWKE